MILGHTGEQLPFAINRRTQRLSHNPRIALERSPERVLRENFFITTSGNIHTPSLLGAIDELGSERVMLACDYPFEQMGDGDQWFDALDLDATARAQIARENAIALLDLSPLAS